MIRALQRQHRTDTQWRNLVIKIFDLEDVHRNIGSHEHYFKASFEGPKSSWASWFYNPTIGNQTRIRIEPTWISLIHILLDVEWYWKCLFKRYVCQGLAMILALLSVLVVWSELTFFNAQPVLSIFAIFVNLAKEYYDYLSIEVSLVPLFVNLHSLKFKISRYSWFRSPPLRTCACAPIQRYWKSESSICTIWRRIIKRTSTVWSSPVCCCVG